MREGLLKPLLVRDTGRATKTPRGERRRTVIVSVLESLRQHLQTFTLSTVIAEIHRWYETGQSCFARLLQKCGLSAPATSLLDDLLPVPSG